MSCHGSQLNDESESPLTKAQYDEIISLAEWGEIEKVKVKNERIEL